MSDTVGRCATSSGTGRGRGGKRETREGAGARGVSGVCERSMLGTGMCGKGWSLTHPEKCYVCRSNTKEFLELIPNRTIVQEEALQSRTNRLGTRVDCTSLEFLADEEEAEGKK